MRRLMTCGAACLAAEQAFSAARGVAIEAAWRRLWCPEPQLIVEQRLEFWRDEIRRLTDRQADARIAEASVPAHLRNADIAVPVRDWAIAGEGLESDAFQSED